VAQFFTNNAAESGFERLFRPANVLPQGFIDERLIVSAPGSFHLASEPGEDFRVEADGDSGFPAGDGNDGSPLCIPETVFTSHLLPRIPVSPWGWLPAPR